MKKKKVLLKIINLKKYFPVKKMGIFQREEHWAKANDGISLCIYEGETLGLVGESGCGKSTLGRVLLQLDAQTEGTILYYGRSFAEMQPRYVEDAIVNLEKNLAKKKKPDHVDLTNVRIFGGFLKAPDLKEVSRVFLEEYRANARLFTLEEEGKSEGSLPEGNTKKREEEISTQREILNRCAAWKKEMREQFSGDEEFMEMEGLRDEGIDLSRLTGEEMRILRKDLQIIFQDPYSSLNPRMSAGQMIGDSLGAHGLFKGRPQELEERVKQVMGQCGLAPYMIHRYPHQFSGGQRQRVGIARALAVGPKFILCDEAVSALDASIQSQILNLLQDLKEQSSLTYLFISHDLSVVKYISDRIGVMYLGNLVELAAGEDLFSQPLHPYTQGLLSAIPTTDPNARKVALLLEGDMPSPINPPEGCKFHTRCPYVTEVCKSLVPQWEERGPDHFVACHNWEKGVPEERSR